MPNSDSTPLLSLLLLGIVFILDDKDSLGAHVFIFTPSTRAHGALGPC